MPKSGSFKVLQHICGKHNLHQLVRLIGTIEVAIVLLIVILTMYITLMHNDSLSSTPSLIQYNANSAWNHSHMHKVHENKEENSYAISYIWRKHSVSHWSRINLVLLGSIMLQIHTTHSMKTRFAKYNHK